MTILIILDLWDYMVKLHILVGNLQSNLQKCQNNLNEIKNVLIPFARQPLFERKDGKKDTVLCIEERDERLAKRHADIEYATTQITNLLNENQKLFEIQQKEDNEKWLNYIDYIDGVISSYMYQSVGCR